MEYVIMAILGFVFGFSVVWFGIRIFRNEGQTYEYRVAKDEDGNEYEIVKGKQ